MRKEIILAIIIGLVFGLIITFGIYFANRSTSALNNQDQAIITPTPSPTIQDNLLSLTSLSDGDIFSDSVATISGSIKDGVTLVIISENNELFITPKNKRFSEEIMLVPGANLIQITALSRDNQRQEVFLNLVYTNAQLDTDK